MPFLRYLCLFCSSVPTVVCRRDHALFTLFVFDCSSLLTVVVGGIMPCLRYLCLFCSYLPTVVCRMDHALLTLFVFVLYVFTYGCL